MTESVLRLVPPTDVDPLYDLADKIRNKFAFADDLDNKAHKTQLAAGKARIMAGQLLLEARDICQQRGEPWEAWCKKNVCIWNRSLRDIRRVMALAEAPDPEAALEAERDATNKQVAAHRANVRPVISTDISGETGHVRPVISTDVYGENGHVCPVSQEPSVELDLAALQSAVKALSTADFTAFKTWFFGYCGRS